jgi:radical SAM protein with 4Fe4S-binding SPASM domain
MKILGDHRNKIMMRLKRVINKLKGHTGKQFVNTAIHIYELLIQKSVLNSWPVVLDITLTKKCNLKCIFCKKYETFGDKQVSIENFRALARNLFPKALQVNFCSGGEPYCHSQLAELLRIAHQYHVEVNVSSNGMLLEKSLIRAIAKEELISKHIFSIDGIKASTVEKIRINSNLGVILNNIKMLLRTYKEVGKGKPSVLIHYVLMRTNIEELPEAVQYWGNLGAEALSCDYVSICRDLDPQESLYFHQELAERIFKKARKVAKHFPDLKLHLPLTIRQEQVHRKVPMMCKRPWRLARIDSDGRVFPCQMSWGAITMGNIYNKSSEFKKDIWNNSVYQALRRTTNNDNVQKFFSYCSVCKNRFGKGNLADHLEDETWFKHLDLSPSEKARIITERYP